ncbi:MAG TPA: hypothetical protein DGT23_22810 [Micromonosporaceae bacterium]|nr:hypothetical protein [Micromonosporaceae bacterium]
MIEPIHGLQRSSKRVGHSGRVVAEHAATPGASRAIAFRLARAHLVGPKGFATRPRAADHSDHLRVGRHATGRGRAPVPPNDLLKLLRSLADPTRLQILQLLARRSWSTREMAGLIGLTEAAISKHLKQLRDARLVRLARESLKALTHGLGELLG